MGFLPGTYVGELTETLARVAEEPAVSVGDRSARAIRVAARTCCSRAKAAFKSWLASPTFASSASSCGSWNSVHHAPRFWVSTGSAAFQSPDSLYASVAGTLSGVL